jgi:hypothetical protein
MPNSPDGRVATDGQCYGCDSPSGDHAPITMWGIWIQGYGGRYLWQPALPPPAPVPYNRTTPTRVVFSNPA